MFIEGKDTASNEANHLVLSIYILREIFFHILGHGDRNGILGEIDNVDLVKPLMSTESISEAFGEAFNQLVFYHNLE